MTTTIDQEDFRIGLKRLYLEISQKFPGDSHLAQINIHLNQLKKKYLKSGLFLLHDPRANGITDFLCAELSAAQFSDESLVIDNSLQVDILITKSKLLSCQSFFPNDIEIPIYFPKSYNQVFNKLCVILKCLKTDGKYRFLKLIRHGIVDVQQLTINYCNCLELSLAFGYMLHKSSNDVTKAVLIFKNRFKFNGQLLINNYVEKDLVRGREIGINTLHDICRTQSNKIPVVIMHKHSLYSKYEICTRYTNKKQIPNLSPLHLLLTQNNEAGHVSNVLPIECLDVSKPHMKYCSYCSRSISASSKITHRCAYPKCKLCSRYLVFTKLNQTIDNQRPMLCYRHVHIDCAIVCKTCRQTFNNLSCFNQHRVIKKLVCSTIDVCQKCNARVNLCKIKQHTCGYFFCKVCLTKHKLGQLECFINRPVFNSFSKETKYRLCVARREKSDYIYSLLACMSTGEMLMQNFPFTNDSDTKPSFGFENNLALIFKYVEEEGKIFTIYVICDEICYEQASSNYIDRITTLSPFLLTVNKNLKFIPMSKFIDLVDPLLSLNLKFKNTSLYIFPNHIIDSSKLLKNKPISVQSNDFQVENVVGSNLDDFTQMQLDNTIIGHLLDNIKTPRQLLNKLAKDRLRLYVFAFKKLQDVYATILERHGIDPTFHIVSRVTLARAGHELFKLSIPPETIHSFSNITNRSLKNTSKFEILVCKVLYKVHKERCNAACQSFICGNGQQYRIDSDIAFGGKTRFSLDFHCSGCNSGYLCSGSFKAICEDHKNESGQLFYKGMTHNEFLEYNAQKINEIKEQFRGQLYIFNECCFKKPPFQVLKDHLKSLQPNCDTNELLSFFHDSMKLFTRDHYEPIDYQHAINSPLIFPASLFCESKGTSEILKFDIQFSYMSALYNSTSLPVGERHILVGDDAHNFVVHALEKGQSCFSVVKVILSHSKDTYDSMIPFLSYCAKKSNKFSTMYSSPKQTSNAFLTFCKKCSDESQKYIENRHAKVPRICKHKEKQRTFISTLLWEDLIFAMGTCGYKLNTVFEVHYWPKSTGINLLKDCAKMFIDMRRMFKQKGLRFEGQILKAIALSGWGRFAINPKHKTINNNAILNSNFDLQSKISQKKIHSFEILKSCKNQKSFALAQNKYTRSDFDSGYLKRQGCFALLFASTSNCVRREIFKQTISIIFSSNLDLVRYNS